MGKLTVKQLEALGREDHGTKLREDGGLVGSVRHGASGVSVYFDWRYRINRKVKQVAVGTWPKQSLAAIRSERDKLKIEVNRGADPAERRKAERLKIKVDQLEETEKQWKRLDEIAFQKTKFTVQGLFELWSEVDLVRRADGGKEVQRMFKKDVLPLLGSLAVEDIKKGHITQVTDPLLARGVNRMAKVVFSLVRQMFRFAVDRDIVEADPTASIRKVKIGGKDVEGDRVLSKDEIRQLAKQVPKAHLMVTTETAIWIVLSTCCRIGELLSARWEHIDVERGTWWIPPEASKNGKAHTVNLSNFSKAQFARVKEINGMSTWCYPNRTNTGSVSKKAVTKQVGDRQRQGKPLISRRVKAKYSEALTLPGGQWTPHDLRRTGATLMVSIGVLPEVADRCLNHVEENKVKRIYQRHSYEAEMRIAWERLGKHLESLTGFLSSQTKIPSS
ncbi:MAG: tyrosine-type recombinase/integrase [Azonexus sp.]|jgi:integrase|nr:tyrosine-type recombinase/integrase [Azonexus sp.]